MFPVASPALFGGRRMPGTLAALAEYPLLHDVDAHPEQPWMSWRAPWSYLLVAPPAHFRRPVVRAFVDWALAEARDEATA